MPIVKALAATVAVIVGSLVVAVLSRFVALVALVALLALVADAALPSIEVIPVNTKALEALLRVTAVVPIFIVPATGAYVAAALACVRYVVAASAVVSKPKLAITAAADAGATPPEPRAVYVSWST